MSPTTVWLLYVLAGYLAGSIPFALLVGKAKGVDLRTVGSKNIGASNAGRVLGKPYFVIVLLLDALKGFIPVLLVGMWLRRSGAFLNDESLLWQQLAWLAVALAAIVGHLLPIYLGFKGGRGVATSLGVVLAVWPYYTIAGALAFVVWAVVKRLSGYISVASIVACVGFPVLVVLVALAAGWPLRDMVVLIAFACLVALLVVVRHLPNIRRLLTGQEFAPDHVPSDGLPPASERPAAENTKQ